jgi:hypothetical protein
MPFRLPACLTGAPLGTCAQALNGHNGKPPGEGSRSADSAKSPPPKIFRKLPLSGLTLVAFIDENRDGSRVRATKAALEKARASHLGSDRSEFGLQCTGNSQK